MKKVFIEKILLLIVVLFSSVLLLYAVLIYYVYNSEKPKYVNGIYVSSLIIINSRENCKINYCKLLKEATKGNTSSIKQLTLLDFYDGVAYDHGSVIVDLIDLIGEDKFIQSIETINKVKKNKISSYLMAGLEYGNNPNLQGKTVKEAFPKIHAVLN